MTGTLVVNEIYLSLQGESTFAGLPCIFVRLTACDLRCSYCDTAYAFTEGKKQTLADVLAAVRRLAGPFGNFKSQISNFKLPLVELTGGEPLLQKNSLPLMQSLCDDGFTVLIETSGAHDISKIDPRVRRIMDLKCPSSGEVERNLFSNLAHLKTTDEIKFVIGTREDYDWARLQIAEHQLAVRRLYALDKVAYVRFASVYRKFETMAEFLRENRKHGRAGRRKGRAMMAGQQIFPEWKTILGSSRLEAQPTRHVVKRSGEVHRYDRAKIEAAVARAFEAVGALGAGSATVEGVPPEPLKRVVDLVEVKLRALMSARHPNSIPAIEEIQDLVETALIEAGEAKVAKAYILYRAKHEAMRDAARLMLDINSTMDGYLSQVDWRVKENANVNYSLGGLILHNSGTITANYWLKNIYPEEIAAAHRDADFHIHDLSMFSGYCAGWSLRQLIAEGLGGIPDKISSKPASHLSTLVQQMVNFLGVLQNEWAGAQALSSFDTYIAPFVRKDGMGETEVRQCMQSFLFGVNTPSRWGSQAPFTNVTLDWTCPADLRDKEAVVGGRGAGFAYGECQAEMDLVNKVFIDLMLEGDAMGRGFQYPIPTYNVTKDFDWDAPNARLLFEMTAKYGTPYFQNFISSDLDPGDVRSMCCRLQLDKRELRKRGGGLFGSDELTGSVGVVTINLPRIGYLAKGKPRAEPAGRLLRPARRPHGPRREVPRDKAQGRLAPPRGGPLPLYSPLPRQLRQSLQYDRPGGHARVLPQLPRRGHRDREGTGLLARGAGPHAREAPGIPGRDGPALQPRGHPAESTSYRLAKHDREKWPQIIASGGDEPYYTNSSQLPVGYTSDIFDALDHQEELQASYTGGTVFHVFLGEAPEDWRPVRDLVKAIASGYRVPYYTISPTFSICPVHGYLAGEHFACPRCKAEKEEGIRGEIRTLEAELAATT